jgi:hypothetical protein
MVSIRINYKERINIEYISVFINFNHVSGT